MSVLGSLSIPTGADGFSNDEFVPFLSLLGDVTLSDELVLTSNLGYNFGYNSSTDFVLFNITPGFTLPNVENTAVFVGFSGMFYGNTSTQHWLEAGATYALKNGAQLDINLGFETEGESIFIGAGFAKGF